MRARRLKNNEKVLIVSLRTVVTLAVMQVNKEIKRRSNVPGFFRRHRPSFYGRRDPARAG
jgi:hypothetical protein